MDNMVMTTENSKSEGRLKDSIVCRKKKCLKNMIKDGKGGPGSIKLPGYGKTKTQPFKLSSIKTLGKSKTKKLKVPSISSLSKSLTSKKKSSFKLTKNSSFKIPKTKVSKIKKINLKKFLN